MNRRPHYYSQADTNDLQTYKVTSLNWRNYIKNIKIEPSNLTLNLPLSACVQKGDILRYDKGDYWVICKNGEAQIFPPYITKERIDAGGIHLEVLIKEITTKEEYEGYNELANLHYRGHEIFGRSARLIIRSFHPLCPQIIGYIELATPFLMNKARGEILNAPFEFGNIYWNQWNIPTIRKYINLMVRIARVVVCPEFRGLGISQILIKHAVEYAKKRWQVALLVPYFLEISADMLKYIPFAEKSGMKFVGATEGNIARVAKDMKYLINRFGKDHRITTPFEESCGICDVQITRMENAMRIMKKTGMDVNYLINKLSKMPKRDILKDYSLFHNVISFPKPHYMLGLNETASQFLENRIAVLKPKNQYFSPKIEINPIKSPLILDSLSISYVSHVRRTKATHAVQQAFGIAPDQIHSPVARNLSLIINPGEIVLIVGPSGSGKTTILDIMKNNGKIEKNLKVEGSIKIPSEANIGSFQSIQSNKPLIELLGSNNVQLGLYILGLAGISEAFLYLKRFQELSKGQQYRAMLAKLIASHSNVWIADEFCTNLDYFTANIVANNVQKIARRLGATVIAATPNCNEFIESFLPDRVILLSNTGKYSIFSKKDYFDLMGINSKNSVRFPTLKLFPEFLSMITYGQKNSTIRRGLKRIKKGLLILESGKELIPVNVTKIIYKRYCNLTEEDAKSEGMEDLPILKRRLEEIYPTIKLNSFVTIIKFEPICGEILNAARITSTRSYRKS
jgi:ABC-type ATPase with predicted acetyltransferase domain